MDYWGVKLVSKSTSWFRKWFKSQRTNTAVIIKQYFTSCRWVEVGRMCWGDQHSQVALFMLTFPLPCASQHWAQGHHFPLVQLNKVPRLEFAPGPVVITSKPQCPPQQFRKFQAVGALILRGIFVSKAIKTNCRSVSALHSYGTIPGAFLETHWSHTHLWVYWLCRVKSI